MNMIMRYAANIHQFKNKKKKTNFQKGTFSNGIINPHNYNAKEFKFLQKRTIKLEA